MAAPCPGDWWDCDWHQRLRFTVGPSTEALVDVPIMLRLPANRLVTTGIAANGADLRVVTSTGTVLAYEVEHWDPQGAQVVWFKLPALQAAETLYLYSGNTGILPVVTGQVWSNAHKGVWHFEAGLRDSSINGHNTVARGSPGATPSSFSQGLGLNPGDGAEVAGPSTLDVPGDLTLSAWVRLDALLASSYGNALMECGPRPGDTMNTAYYFFIDSTGHPQLLWEAGSGGVDVLLGSSVAITDLTTQWHHIAAVRNISGRKVAFYLDGAALGASRGFTYGPSATTACTFRFGVDTKDPDHHNLDGMLDELRVENVARSPEWLRVQHASMADTLITWGTPELR